MTRKTLISHWLFLVILFAYFVLAISYSLVSPLYEPTDELRHFRYVRHIIAYHSLPVQQTDAPRAQSHHPPLYYTLGAMVSWWVPVEREVYYEPPTNRYWGYQYWEVGDDNKNQYLHRDDERFPFHGVALAVHVVRCVTILIGGGVVWLTYRLGREILPDWTVLAASAAAMVAFNPQFLYLSGAVNNDIAAALWGAAVLLVCMRLIRQGPRLCTDVTLGILYGLALLTKLHLLALLAPIGLTYLIAARRARPHPPTRPFSHALDLRAFVRGMLIILGLAALISGWWFWRNYVLYGDLTGMRKVNELWAGRPASENLWTIRQSLPYLWSSLWGRFGYGQVPMPQAIYRGVLGGCLVALAGYLIPRRGSFPGGTSLLTLTPLAFTAVVCYYILIQPAGAMGRFLFPALPAFAVLLCAGLNRFPPLSMNSAFHSRMIRIMGLGVSVGMATLAIYALTVVLAPAFARPHPLTQSKIEAAPNPTSIDFGPSVGSGQVPSVGTGQSVARLLGYKVAPDIVQPGDTVDVTVYWQALARTNQDYAVFVHLLSEVGTMVAQRDTHPGLGRYPTTIWEPGIAFADTYRVQIPETAYAPDSGYIQVGMYLPNGARLTAPDGRDALPLATVEIQPRPGELPNPLNVNFDNQVTLVGYQMDRRVVHPGDTICLTLFWRAQVPIGKDYRIFAHVLGVENQIWANTDSPPTLPTSQWQPDEIVEDVRDLTIGLTAPQGSYDIEVGMYPTGGPRLPVVAEDGHWFDNRVLLSKIQVVVE